jgi:hypothetical protein
MPKSRTPSTQSSASDPGANQVTALLLDVLRNVNREVQTTLELDATAQAAVDHFRAISLSLRTLADGSTSSSGTVPSPGAAPGAPDR